MRYDVDVLVVGGGIVGLSTAYALTRAQPGLSVTVLEKEPVLAAHQTGRNSGVIHSGVYYRPGSLKARFATAGAAEMVGFCREHGVPYEVTGKLIVATGAAELPRLAALAERGRANGIPVTELDAAGITGYEPEVRGIAGLHVGTTGICDFPAVARRYAELAEEKGAVLRTGTALHAAARRADGVTVQTGGGELRCAVLVNCAGLQSDRLARMTGDDPGVRIVPFRGEYYELAEDSRRLVRGLVYPVPDPAFPFLGVHLTRGVHGDVHVGPNAVPALAREGYDWRTVRPRDVAATAAFPGTWRIARRHWRYELGELHRSLSKRAFTAAVQRLLPAVTAADLVPATAGVRAQAVARDGTLLDDFAFAGYDPDDPASPAGPCTC
ncbi:L-2-hydroxyglutarate oxidase [Kitasatospora paranensis]